MALRASTIAGTVGIRVIPIFEGMGKALSNEARKDGAEAGAAYAKAYQQASDNKLTVAQSKMLEKARAAEAEATAKITAAEERLARVRAERNPAADIADSEVKVGRARMEADEASKRLERAELDLNLARRQAASTGQGAETVERAVAFQRREVEKASKASAEAQKNLTRAEREHHDVVRASQMLSADEIEAEREIVKAREDHQRVLEKYAPIFERARRAEAANTEAQRAAQRVEESNLTTKQRVVRQLEKNIKAMGEHSRAASAMSAVMSKLKMPDLGDFKSRADFSSFKQAGTILQDLSMAASGTAVRLGAVMAVVPLLAGGLVSLGAAAVSAAGGLTMIGMAGAAGFGAAFLALKPVAGAFQALGAAEKQSAMDAQTSAKAQSNAARQIASAKKGIADAARAAAEATRAAQKAEAQANRQVIEAQKGVRDAVRASAEARRKASEDVAKAAKAAQEAERNVARVAEEGAQRIVEAKRAERDAIARIAEARRDAANAARAVADAQRDVERATRDTVQVARDNARAMRDALDAQADAERRVIEAQKSAKQAQRDLVAARQEAIDQLRDLAGDVRDSDLDVRGAQLRVERARASLARVLADKEATSLDRREAQLSLDEALRSQEKVAERAAKLREEQAKANAAGVEGSEVYKRALQGVVDANGKVIDAQRKVADANERVTDVQEKNAERTRDAQDRVYDAQQKVVQAQEKAAEAQAKITQAQEKAADATRKVREAERDAAQAVADAKDRAVEAKQEVLRAQEAVTRAEVEGAERIADANERLSDARERAAEAAAEVARTRVEGAERVKEAQQRLADAEDAASLATGRLTSSQNNLNDAMAKLSPEGQRFVRMLYEMSKGMEGLSKKAQTAMFPGLIDGMNYLRIYGPGFERFLVSVSAKLGDMGREAGKALASPEWQRIFSRAATDIPQMLETGMRSVGHIVTGIATLLDAMSPHFKDVAFSVERTTKGFADWSKEWVKSDGFKSFMAYLKQNGPMVKDFFKALGPAVANLAKALAPIGEDLLRGITKFLNWFASKSPEELESWIRFIVKMGVGLVALGSAAKVFKVAEVFFQFFKVIGLMAKGTWKFTELILGLGNVKKAADMKSTADTVGDLADALDGPNGVKGKAKGAGDALGGKDGLGSKVDGLRGKTDLLRGSLKLLGGALAVFAAYDLTIEGVKDQIAKDKKFEAENPGKKRQDALLNNKKDGPGGGFQNARNDMAGENNYRWDDKQKKWVPKDGTPQAAVSNATSGGNAKSMWTANLEAVQKWAKGVKTEVDGVKKHTDTGMKAVEKSVSDNTSKAAKNGATNTANLRRDMSARLAGAHTDTSNHMGAAQKAVDDKTKAAAAAAATNGATLVRNWAQNLLGFKTDSDGKSAAARKAVDEGTKGAASAALTNGATLVKNWALNTLGFKNDTSTKSEEARKALDSKTKEAGNNANTNGLSLVKKWAEHTASFSSDTKAKSDKARESFDKNGKTMVSNADTNGKGIFEKVKSWMGNTQGTVDTHSRDTKSLWERMWTAIKGNTNDSTAKVAGTLAGAIPGFGRAWSGIVGALNGPSQKAVDDVLNPLGQNFNKFAEALGVPKAPEPSWVDKVKGWVAPVFKVFGRANGGPIPRLFAGGTVPGPVAPPGVDNTWGVIAGKAPVALAGGEMVINNTMTRAIDQAAPGFLDELNLKGPAALNGWAFANGGRTPSADGSTGTGRGGNRPALKRDVATLLALVQAQVGDRYYLGAHADYNDPNPSVFDCSEIIEWATVRMGMGIFADDPVAATQYARSLKIPYAQGLATPGAMLFYPNLKHVELSLGNGYTVGAANPRAGVRVAKAWGFSLAGLIPGLEYGNISPELLAKLQSMPAGGVMDPKMYLQGTNPDAYKFIFETAPKLAGDIKAGKFGGSPRGRENAGSAAAILTTKAQDALVKAAPAFDPSGPTGSFGPLAPVQPGSARSIVQQLAAQRGWTGEQWNALDWIVNHESSWNVNAKNPSSTAYGLFQFLDSTRRQYGYGNTAETQGRAGLQYIADRYGDPIKARAFWQAHRWYNQGGRTPESGDIPRIAWDIEPGRSGYLPEGFSLAYNGTGKPERLTREAAPQVTPEMLREALAGVDLNITGVDQFTGIAHAQIVAAGRRRVGA